MTATILRCVGAVALCSMLSIAAVTCGQDVPAEDTAKDRADDKQTSPEVELPVIPSDPKTVDPATLLPDDLTRRATCDLTDSSVTELIEWLRQEQGLVVLLDKEALDDVGMLPSEPVSDRLDDAPVYLLLNRLESLGLGWYLDDHIVHVTTAEEAEDRRTTSPHTIGDLLDKGYEVDVLIDLITSTVAPASWEEVGGPGVLSSLGDVLFVRQSDDVQRQVQGLLIALRQHGRMTFAHDPPQHVAFRQKLKQLVTVDFRDMPLESAVATLAERSGIDIRLDMPTLRDLRIRPRQPVSVTLKQCKLETVLQAMLMDLDLTWILRDGVLWVTSEEEAESLLKTAVFDVRDLCRDDAEAGALLEAITSQASPQSWDTVGGPGSVVFARPGTMVVSHQERVLMEVLDLLEIYRTALRSSKPRDRDVEDEDEVTTVYYRLHADVADDLLKKLRRLVRPESWKSKQRPEAVGTILRVASPPEVLGAAVASGTGTKTSSGPVVLSQQAVLIITQTRGAHKEIGELIHRVESGDPVLGAMGGGMGGFGGMGGIGGMDESVTPSAGFGGGFFAVPHE